MLNFLFPFLFLTLSLPFHFCGLCPLLIICMMLSYQLFVISLDFPCLLSLASAFVGVEIFAPDKKRLVLSKHIVKFSLNYSVSRNLLHVRLYINHQFIYLLRICCSSKIDENVENLTLFTVYIALKNSIKQIYDILFIENEKIV